MLAPLEQEPVRLVTVLLEQEPVRLAPVLPEREPVRLVPVLREQALASLARLQLGPEPLEREPGPPREVSVAEQTPHRQNR